MTSVTTLQRANTGPFAPFGYAGASDTATGTMCTRSPKSTGAGMVKLTALPSIKAEYWIAAVQETDALLVNGGDVLYRLPPNSAPVTRYVNISSITLCPVPIWSRDDSYEESTPIPRIRVD